MEDEHLDCQDAWNRTLSNAMPAIALGIAFLHAAHAAMHSQFWNSAPMEPAFYPDVAVFLVFLLMAFVCYLRPLAHQWSQLVLGLIVIFLFLKVAYHKLFESHEPQIFWFILFGLLAVFTRSRRIFFNILVFMTSVAVYIEFQIDTFSEPASSRALMMLAVATGALVLFLVLRGQHMLRGALRKHDRELTKNLKAGEERYRLLTQHTTDVIWTINNKGIITYLSSSDKNWLGLTAESLVGKPMSSDIIKAGSLKLVQEHFARAFSGEFDKICIEAEHIKFDGTTIWCELQGTVVRDQSGEVEAVYGATRDISERRFAEDQLKESEERYRNISENSGDIVYVFDASGIMTYVSPSVINILGYTPDERLGKHFSELKLSPESARIAKKTYSSMVSGKLDVGLFEVQQQKKDGEWIWAEMHAQTRRSADSSLEAVHVTARDVTDRRRTAELLDQQRLRLAERASQLTELNQQLDDFSSTISHDLQSPLRRIQRRLAKVEAKLKDTDSGPGLENANDLQVAIGEASDMSDLIDHLLETSRSHKRNIIRESIDVESMTRRVAANCSLDSGRSYQLKVPRMDTVYAQADGKLLELVFANLIGNAFKHTPGDVSLVITFTINAINGEKVYGVADNGSGFGDSKLEPLFGSFQRGENQDTVPGYGIGLATVRNIIDRHGGRIWAENIADGGAIVRFTLAEEDPC